MSGSRWDCLHYSSGEAFGAIAILNYNQVPGTISQVTNGEAMNR